MLAGRQGSVSYLSKIFHHRVHENYKPAQVGGWGVVVGYDEKEFLRPIGDLRWITMLALAVTLALLSGIVLLATQVALRPLTRLTVVSDEIGHGNLDCEIRPPARAMRSAD